MTEFEISANALQDCIHSLLLEDSALIRLSQKENTVILSNINSEKYMACAAYITYNPDYLYKVVSKCDIQKPIFFDGDVISNVISAVSPYFIGDNILIKHDSDIDARTIDISSGKLSMRTTNILAVRKDSITYDNVKKQCIVSANIQVSMFKRILKAFSPYTHSLDFIVRDSALYIGGEMQCVEGQNTYTEFKLCDVTEISSDMDFDKHFRSRYNIDAINFYVEHLPAHVWSFNVFFNKDYPIVFEYSMYHDITMYAVLAPRISDN